VAKQAWLNNVDSSKEKRDALSAEAKNKATSGIRYVKNQQIDTKNRVEVQEQIESHVWKVVAVVLWGPLMTQLDSTVVNPARSSFHT
jgi:hypothetical protein